MSEAAKQPQNVAATATGALAIAAIWVWNQFQMVEQCGLQGVPALLDCEIVPGRLFLADEIYASVVLLITALTGPLLRKYLAWASNGKGAALDVLERLEHLEAANKADE